MFSRPFALSAVIAVLVAFAGVAGASERLGWEDLAPPFDGTADPPYRLSDDVQADFYDLMWARSLVADMKTLKKTHSSIRAVGASAQNMKAKLEATEAEARANLEAAGVDIAALIAEAEAYDEQLAVHNATLVDALDGWDAEIPGYALPLEYACTEISEILLVPYVGACIHVPPLPNQIVHVRFAKRFLLIHEAQQGCRDATYEPSRFPVAVPYPSPHRATPAYVVVTSSDLDTSKNKASVSGLSWISRKGFEGAGLFTPVLVAGPMSAGRSSQSLSYVDGSADIAVGYSLDASAIEIYDR